MRMQKHTHKHTHEQNNNMQSLTKPGVGHLYTHFSPFAFSLTRVETGELSMVLKTFCDCSAKVEKTEKQSKKSAKKKTELFFFIINEQLV